MCEGVQSVAAHFLMKAIYPVKPAQYRPIPVVDSAVSCSK